MIWLYFALIGIACGLILRERGPGLFGYLVVAVIGAIPGGWLFMWSNLFPYGEFVGAFAGAALLVGIKRAFRAGQS